MALPVLGVFPPSHTVYLRTSPEVCMQRIQQRARQEEKPVTVVSDNTQRSHAVSVAHVMELVLVAMFMCWH